MMDFFNRTHELERLDELFVLSRRRRQLVYITGRRRVGKTELLNKFSQGTKSFYLFVGKDTEAGFLQTLSSLIAREADFSPHVKIASVYEAVEFILGELLDKRDLVILDEFQNFKSINPAILGHFQHFWDKTRNKRGMIVVCGSLQSMMHDIFENEREPLYKRATARLVVDEFQPSALHDLVSSSSKHCTPRRFFDLYSIFGGIPFYYDLLDAHNLFDAPLAKILQSLVIDKNAVLYDEGKELTIEALGKNYALSYAILSVVGAGSATHGEILNATGENYGVLDKYLRMLIEDYRFLARTEPVGTGRKRVKSTRYAIRDNFLAFWFRYVHSVKSLLEAGRTQEAVRNCIDTLPVFQGRVWEKLAAAILVELNTANGFEFAFQEIGPYFRQNSGGEIDIVLIDKVRNRYAACECKLNINGCNIPSVMGRLSDAQKGAPWGAPWATYLLSVTDVHVRTSELIRRYDNVKVLSLSDLLGMLSATNDTRSAGHHVVNTGALKGRKEY